MNELEKLLKAGTPTPWFVGGVRFKMNGRDWHGIMSYDEAKRQDNNVCLVGYDPRTGEGHADVRLIVAAVNALPELLAVKADMAKLNEPDGVLINMMRGTIPKVPSTSLHKLYTEDELIDAAKAVFRARAAFNQETKL